MKKFLQKNKPDILFVLAGFISWRIFLFFAQLFSQRIPLNQFFGKSPLWQNFDGYHYQFIAHHGYGQYEQAFFPLFPLTLSFIEKIFPLQETLVGLFLVSCFFITGLFIFLKLLEIDMSVNKAKWVLIFLLIFPTSFFFGSIYSESLFFLLLVGSFYLMRKKRFFLAASLAGLASATRVVGIFLMVSILIDYIQSTNYTFNWKTVKEKLVICLLSASGLLSYMIFLWVRYNDPLLFVHTQPNFGAGRSVNHIVLLPQVLFRYIKIFFTVSVLSHDFLVALLEFSITIISLLLLIFFWKRVRLSYLIFSFLVILLPTVSGTLSSEPRYVLVAFPLYMILSSCKNTQIRISLIIISSVLLFTLCAFFLRGYFIA